jgi:hypothetical protein
MSFLSFISPVYIKQGLASLLAMEVVQLSRLFIKVQWLSSLLGSIYSGVVGAVNWLDNKLSISQRLNDFNAKVNGYIDNTENNWFGRRGLQFCRFLCRLVSLGCQLISNIFKGAVSVLANPLGSRVAFVISTFLLFLAPVSAFTAGICVALACVSALGGYMSKYLNDEYITRLENANDKIIKEAELTNSPPIQSLQNKAYTPTWSDKVYEAVKLNFIEAASAIAISLLLGNWWVALISVPTILFNNNGSILSLDDTIKRRMKAEDIANKIKAAKDPIVIEMVGLGKGGRTTESCKSVENDGQPPVTAEAGPNPNPPSNETVVIITVQSTASSSPNIAVKAG